MTETSLERLRAISRSVLTLFVLGVIGLDACSLSGPAPTPAPPPSGGWTRQFGSPDDDWAYSLTADGNGNVHVAGTTGLSIGVPPSEEVGAFLAKYDAQGKEAGASKFRPPQVGPPKNAFTRRALVDGMGNVYLAGWTDDAPPAQRPSPRVDAFLTKYDGSGREVWTRQFGSPGQDWILGVAVDGEGNIYVGGRTDGALPGQLSSGQIDAFLMKFDSAGKELWTRQFGSPADEWVMDLAVDGAGNVYGAGGTWGALPGQKSSGQEDAFLVKYNGQGKGLWTRQFGSTVDERVLGLAVDGAGNVYGAGWTEGVLPKQRSSGKRDAFLRKYDGRGSEVWTRQFGTPEGDEALSVAVDGVGNAYAAGSIKGALPGQGAAGLEDAFIAKFDGRGRELWAHQFGSFMTDQASNVAVDGAGAVYVAGQTWGSLPGQRSSGRVDAFLVKIE
ncbi:MAG: SBBP repeat-containing protein [Chloroflexi bacterium]|nr:SBBP repeat-containing protein [Chloroflexota bacterium]